MAKTRNHSIRFEESDYEFISKREGLKTAQSILNFLLSNYLKLYKVEKKSVFDLTPFDSAPIMQSKETLIAENNIFIQPEPYKYFDNAPAKQITKTFNQYINLKKELEFDQEYIDFYKEVDADLNLTTKQKQTIKQAT